MIVESRSRDAIAVQSTCKLNLFLEVVRKRADDYHDIETLFQEIDLKDRIIIRRADAGVEFTCNIINLARPGENLVERAAARFFTHTGIRGGVAIALEKRIPAGAGVGGGSANATATLQALDLLFETKLPLREISQIACSLGSDCPFFVLGGAAVGHGRGELLEPVSLPRRAFLLVIPPLVLSTAAVYARVSPDLATRDSVRALPLSKFESMNVNDVESAIFNRLETAAIEAEPRLNEIRRTFERAGIPRFHLTGSGSGSFAVFETLTKAVEAAESFRSVRGSLVNNAQAAGLLKDTKVFAVESLGRAS